MSALTAALGILAILPSRDDILADIIYRLSRREKISYNIPSDIAMVRAVKKYIKNDFMGYLPLIVF